MDRFLEIAHREVAIPDGGAPDFSTFADEEVAWQQKELEPVLRVEVHRGQIFHVDATPLNVNISEVRRTVVAGNLLLIQHLAELDVVPSIQGCYVPVAWNTANPLDTRRLHCPTRVQTGGDCAYRERQIALDDQVCQTLLFRDQVVDFGYFAAEKFDNTVLFVCRRRRAGAIRQQLHLDTFDGCAFLLHWPRKRS